MLPVVCVPVVTSKYDELLSKISAVSSQLNREVLLELELLDVRLDVDDGDDEDDDDGVEEVLYRVVEELLVGELVEEELLDVGVEEEEEPVDVEEDELVDEEDEEPVDVEDELGDE
jgi:hypothetical protein